MSSDSVVTGRAETFSLLGGPLHRLGCRLGLVRGGTNTVALGVALGAFLWIVLAALALVEGLSDQVFSLAVIGGHVRLLVVIPLFFLCESVLDPRLTGFVRTIVRSEVVSRTALPQLESEIARIARCKDAWLPEAIFLLAAVLLAWIGPHLNLPGTSAAYDPGRTADGMALTGQWYWMVCLTVFRFLMLRWVWRLALWSFFLWRLSRLELRLVPTHPDGAAGLGCLETAQTQFVPLILAISAVQSAAFAEELSAGTMAFEEIYSGIVLVLVVDAVLFLGPLFIFAQKLWLTRVRGLGDYMSFAAHYVNDFDRKWLRAGGAPREDLLGTADLQSLADLNNSVSIVREMRWVPMSMRMLTEFVLAAVLPALPLLLFKYPLAELAQKFLARLTGM